MNAIVLGIALPLLGTTLGAALVFVLRGQPGERLKRALMGFASGVMIAASVWSLLLPAIELSETGPVPDWLPATGGFLLGAGFLLLLEWTAQKLDAQAADSPGKGMSREALLFLAVTLHNLPEGMAVGVVLAGLLSGAPGITAAGALALSAGIAVQNFPEGAIISLPLAGAGCSRRAAFFKGFLSGVVEPIGAIATLLLTWLVTPILPLLLAFAAGAMLFVVVEELIPESQAGAAQDNSGTLGAVLGFALMMLLDVALG